MELAKRIKPLGSRAKSKVALITLVNYTFHRHNNARVRRFLENILLRVAPNLVVEELSTRQHQ